jgi:hypothetical protein
MEPQPPLHVLVSANAGLGGETDEATVIEVVHDVPPEGKPRGRGMHKRKRPRPSPAGPFW